MLGDAYAQPGSREGKHRSTQRLSIRTLITTQESLAGGTQIGVGLNGSVQRGVECLGWCHPAQGLSRPSVELACDLVEVVLAVGREAGPLREVLT